MIKFRCAFHEAGHLVVLVELGGAFSSINIEVRGNEGGDVLGLGGLDDQAMVICAAAGVVAELRHAHGRFELTSQSWGSILLDVIHRHGGDARVILGRPGLDSWGLARRSLDILHVRWPEVEQIAAALVDVGRLSDADARGMLSWEAR